MNVSTEVGEIVEVSERKSLPSKARAVIIGGGVSGCSVAYHLAKLGWTDVILLERKKLTCGTTWHAAGLVSEPPTGSRVMTNLYKYSMQLYSSLEAETGIATGLRRTGSLSIALTEERKHELYRQLSLAPAVDVQARKISVHELKEMYPHVDVSDVTAALHFPNDGQCDPTNVTMALAKGARKRGAAIFEGVQVTGVQTSNGRVSSVTWEKDGERGLIETDNVVNCAGMWARELGLRSNIGIPLHACEHFYMLTEPIEGLTRLPVLRVRDEQTYYKEDAGKILFGAVELKAKPWGMDGIPESFCFDQLPEDFAHFEPIMERALKRMPILATAGIRTFFNGPESFTPDDNYHLGEAPELRGYWVACGYNTGGIASSGGAGLALAQWMNDGEPPFDVSGVDIRRMQPFQRNRSYLKERVSEVVGLTYADDFPARQKTTSRGIRRSPIHEHLKVRGAVFGEAVGWERANWFAREDQEREYRYSWHRQNWFDNQRDEHVAVREQVGIFDLTSFGKIRVEGRDACSFLQQLCSNDVDVPVGRIVYTQMLNERGGIESDLTVSRLTETAYLLVVSAYTLYRDLYWLRRHVDDRFVVITDMSASESVLAVMGPKSRELLGRVSPNDFYNTNNPFGTFQEIEIGMSLARAHRVTYVGEMGWEIFVPTDQAAHVFEVIEVAGADIGLKLCGLHAILSCRIEKAYRGFGEDIGSDDHVLEAGLGFAVKTAKPAFIGRDSVLRKREAGLERRLVQFLLKDPAALMHRNEVILRDGRMVGTITSGDYGHTLGGAVGLGYVPCKNESEDELLSSSYEIEIAGERFAADVSLKPMYDPKSERVRA
ncbi:MULTISPECIES: FAD-dependent oxidoreductase [unclassified Mesorhizobium]|uniref:GcvT family protein n=1 Tax=unclassified Mesorhizobium TaxID=325217 RepID=UPI000FE82F5E|nr:FAD-dependent oxidoreductase [Mesorhizobium sp.]RWD53731.1 MAG: FAD-dependent oxidoreductase [Mesorhizobium sp.]RWJ22615.1 MAG: FAD-dependent oxidoreductase [Mesorhizobium sp.]RWN15080.1 MAG: FAD-dependent oxidoreductase [Mesorhizobium sp.]RWN21006.1 MAG: FAD-dependent oxidoreductase [Mesorhizobium sp.]RWQ55959.1 MAG: FAD-dependent oxidoreductase [Mesorhizobium sp.]